MTAGERRSAHADAHAAGHGEQLAVIGHVAGLAGNISKTVLGDMAVEHGHGHAVPLDLHQLGGVTAKLGGQHTVIGAGAAAALHVARDADTGLHAGLFLNGGGDAVGGGGAGPGFQPLCHPLFPLHLGFLAIVSALGHGQDGEVGAPLCPALHGVADPVDVVGFLGDEDDVRTACNAGVEGQPACLVAHDLNAHHAAVAACRGVDAVDDVGGDVHSGVKAERYVGAVDVVVDGFGQADDVEPLLGEEVGRFVGAVTAQAEQAVEAGFLIGTLHGGHFINVVVFHHPHHLKGGALGAQNGAAQRQDASEIVLSHLLVFPGDEAVIAVENAHDLDIFAHAGIQRLGNAADGGVQARAVAAGGQDTNTFFHSANPSFPQFYPRGRGTNATIRIFPNEAGVNRGKQKTR